MKRQRTTSFAILLLLALPLEAAQAGVTASYRYALSNFSGPVRSHWAQLAVDRERNEVFALNQRANDIRIFDEHGMEVFVFGEGFASAADLSAAEDGNLFILSKGYETFSVYLVNYRGERLAEIEIRNIPEQYAGFVADRLVYRDDLLYLADLGALQIVVVDKTGRFLRGYDLNRQLRRELPREKRFRRELQTVDWARQTLQDLDMRGFAVDRNGNLLFTVPAIFAAFRMSPDGELVRFGRSGSGSGKFGVAAGVTTDDDGYVYISDRLRCVVLVFDEDLNFQTEFGYRGDRPSNLIVPDDLAIDASGNLYVGQAANRGVSVFKVEHDTSASQLSSVEPEAEREQGQGMRTVRSKVPTSPTKRERAAEAGASDRSKAAARRGGRNMQVKSISEKAGRAAVVSAPDREEFTVDRGDDSQNADSGEGGWVFEESGTNQAEVKK